MTLQDLYFQGQKTKTDQPKQVTRVVHPHDRVGDIIVLAAIFGILGSRLFSILENMDTFLRDPIGQLFSGSGLTIYGGFILATIACNCSSTYTRLWHRPFRLSDIR